MKNKLYILLFLAFLFSGTTHCALQNATSVASTFLTTESCVANIKEETPAMPAGGAPGMGGMM